jgi:putative FmdB family regulatory protein
MPIYEYRCQSCGHELEALQKIDEGTLRKCPACGALKLKRLVSAPSFRLKGTGWYETDFKKDGRKKLADTADGKSDQSEGGKDGQKDGQKDDQSEGKKDTKEASDKSAGADARPDKAAAPKSETKSESKAATKSGSGKASAPPD